MRLGVLMGSNRLDGVVDGRSFCVSHREERGIERFGPNPRTFKPLSIFDQLIINLPPKHAANRRSKWHPNFTFLSFDTSA